MLFGNRRLFAAARNAKRGKITLPPALARLREWVSDQYSVSVIHIVFDAIEIGPNEGKPRLNLIVETDVDYDTLKKNVTTFRPNVRRRILHAFTRFADDLEPNRYHTEDVHLILDNFADECLGQACSQFLRSDRKLVIEALPDVPIWDITGLGRCLVAFLRTDEEVRVRQADGTCDRISRSCFQHIKPYDEFGYLTPKSFRLRFDSKENLDRTYKGNLFHYFR